MTESSSLGIEQLNRVRQKKTLVSKLDLNDVLEEVLRDLHTKETSRPRLTAICEIPQCSYKYPLNLSILLGGGKKTNQYLYSNGV